MGARASARSGLSEKEIENLTDFMLAKLAMGAWGREPDLDPGEVNRNEIRQIIVDTVILCESEDPHAMLDRWMEGT